MHGQVAEAFGETVTNLWESPSFGSYAPRRLKGTCSRFAPQFAGYGQHDTQEFLAFLLDGLHEDLNRIKKKPYIEKPDWKAGGGDRELAELGRVCWDGYKQRNDSVIVDLFQGQLQSTLVCPECHKESITMDPFMYLTVPLPISQTRIVKVIFFPRDVEKPPVNVHLLLPANASFAALKDKLGRLTGTQGSNIVGFDLWKGGIYQWWMDMEPMTQIGDNDVPVFYELGAPVSASGKGVGTIPTDESVTVPVFTFLPNEYQGRSTYSRDIPDQCALEPFFITLSKSEAADPAAVREAIMRGYSRLVRPSMRGELWVASNDPHAKILVDDDESVAEIRIDSSPVSTSEASLAPSDVPRNQSHVSLASQSGRLVTRGDLFKVYVADASSADSRSGTFFGTPKKDPAINVLYKGSPQTASGSWSGLEKRARAKKPMLQRISSGIFGSAANSDDEGEASAVSPCVRKGEGIFVQWSSEEFYEFFERDRDGLVKHLDDVIDPDIAKDKEKKKAGRNITLDDCLDEFSKQETLGRDDEWYCPVCKKHVQATKKLDIYKAPDILVICLKRFGSARTLRDKLDHMVQYPLEGLNLDERIGERRITQSLKLTDEEAKHYGIEHSTEPFIYDLCESSHVTEKADNRRCRQPLWWPGRRPLHCVREEQGRRELVQLRRQPCVQGECGRRAEQQSRLPPVLQAADEPPYWRHLQNQGGGGVARSHAHGFDARLAKHRPLRPDIRHGERHALGTGESQRDVACRERGLVVVRFRRGGFQAQGACAHRVPSGQRYWLRQHGAVGRHVGCAARVRYAHARLVGQRRVHRGRCARHVDGVGSERQRPRGELRRRTVPDV